MAQNNVKYSFKSTGIRPDEVSDISRNSSPIPVSIKTPIMFDRTGNSIFKMHENNVDAVKDNLKNLIACDHGSRLFMGDFGANLTEVISLIGTEDGDARVMERINSAVSKFMPYVSLAGYEPVRKVTAEGNLQRLGINLTFAVPSISTEVISMNIDLYEAK